MYSLNNDKDATTISRMRSLLIRRQEAVPKFIIRLIHSTITTISDSVRVPRIT